MQVKRRINHFFGSIRRKDKGSLDEEREPPSRAKKKWRKSKNNQNYSQWDLIGNIGENPTRDEEILNEIQVQSEICRLQLGESANPQNYLWNEKENLVKASEDDNKKRKSFLKRSGSLLRRSMRRSKKPTPESQTHPDPLDDDNVVDIVQEINETLVAVATFGESSNNVVEHNFANFEHHPISSTEDFTVKIVEVQLHNNNTPNDADIDAKAEKFALKKGLQRQASKIISKFQRTTGSLRLKSATSIDSFPNNTFPRQRRTASFNGADAIVEPTEDRDRPTKTGSFRRKISFKKTKKALTKGVISLGKNMTHASAVMPLGYEYPPPVNYYTDYEAGYPTEIEHHYYRTQSYLPKNWDDERNLQYSRKPASFYQHGYCYNG